MIDRGRRAALFDMDHTILRVDSSMSWMRFLRSRGELERLQSLRALWWAAQYKLAVLDLDTLAERLAAGLRGDSEAEMRAKSSAWHAQDLVHEVVNGARIALAGHRERGDIVALVTGASQFAAGNVAATLGIEHVLCTELDVRDGVFTGKLKQRCFGRHKVAVAERWARDHGVDLAESVFYSDSYNDLPMLSRVGRPTAVNPDVRLRRHAESRGWPIAIWS